MLEQKEIKEIGEEIRKAIKQDMAPVFDKINERFDKMDEKFDNVDKRFDEIDKRFSNVDKRFDEIDKRFSNVDKRFDEIDERFNKTDKNIQEVRQEVKKEVGEMIEQNIIPVLDGMDERIQRIEALMVTKPYLDEKLADLEGTFIASMRKEDKKVNLLIELLRKRKVLKDIDIKMLDEIRVFPSLVDLEASR